jgi:hypothetical protein
MDPEGLLACSQHFANGSYPESDGSTSYFYIIYNFFKIHSHIILPVIPESPNWPVPFQGSDLGTHAA